MLSVSGRMSTNTGVAPRSTNALAVETNVNDGMMTSSPGPRSSSIAAISSAAGARMRQQRRRRAESGRSSQAWQRLVKQSVAGELAGGDGFLDVRELPAGQVRSIEGKSRHQRESCGLNPTISSDPPTGKRRPRRMNPRSTLMTASSSAIHEARNAIFAQRIERSAPRLTQTGGQQHGQQRRYE